jgi:hypothetical protein
MAKLPKKGPPDKSSIVRDTLPVVLGGVIIGAGSGVWSTFNSRATDACVNVLKFLLSMLQ